MNSGHRMVMRQSLAEAVRAAVAAICPDQATDAGDANECNVV